MWILKGTLLGLAVFLAGAVAFLYWHISASGANATGITVIQGLTVQNPLFWIGLLACVAAGCAVSRGRRRTS